MHFLGRRQGGALGSLVSPETRVARTSPYGQDEKAQRTGGGCGHLAAGQCGAAATLRETEAGACRGQNEPWGPSHMGVEDTGQMGCGKGRGGCVEKPWSGAPQGEEAVGPRVPR